MDVLTRLFVMIGLLSVGVGLRAVGVLTAKRVRWLNAIAFYGVLPALVFDSTYDQPLATLVTPVLLVGIVGILGVTAGVSWGIHRRIDDDDSRAAATVQSYHTNLGYIGLPVVATTLGERAAGIASVILGMSALVQIPLTISFLVGVTGQEANLLEKVRQLMTNPVLLALIVGLAVSRSSLTVPSAGTSAISLLAKAALPIALLCVGGSIRLESVDTDRSVVASVLVLKLLVMPAIAWLGYAMLGADIVTIRTAIIMFGSPTAVSTFIYVTEMGGDRRLASLLIFVSTVTSVFTLSAWIILLP